MKIAIVANTTWYIYNFRSSLIKRILNMGHEVVVISPRDGSENKILQLEVSYLPWKLNSRSISIFHEAFSILDLFLKLKNSKIDLVLSFTPKGNIYSNLIARFLNINYIPNISGLGSGFMDNNSPTNYLFKMLWKISLAKAQKVLFQNNEDLEFFKQSSIFLGPTLRLPGSGVDLEKFPPKVQSSGCKSFLLVARLIWSKGVGEYVEAAREIKQSYPGIEFNILGFIDNLHPDGIPEEKINEWHREGVINYLGETDDVKYFLESTDCVVLPSYYGEGVPRSLLEAASMAIPIVTTNHQGCRDAIVHAKTGFLCEVKNSKDLKDQLIKIIEMNPKQLKDFGMAGRKMMESEFDEDIVLNKYKNLIENIV
jgi:glycosyltransferase involved in cell wall biosynthesis